MQIPSGAQSLQVLKAQQAWEARRAGKTETQKPAAQTAPVIEIAKPELPVDSVLPAVSPQWQRRVNEIQNIATKAGFVDVTEQDIRKAYQFGESLLADYRV
ncbi:hypothetical protein [Vampirovibrio sp.]|uniref:hypothetical protein n=1 Tax=Vampirovibrio sp. TaxID=2717857 RepID=UPI0035938A18